MIMLYNSLPPAPGILQGPLREREREEVEKAREGMGKTEGGRNRGEGEFIMSRNEKKRKEKV